MARLDDAIVDTSIALGNIPFDFQIQKFSGAEGGFAVTLYSVLGSVCTDAVTGTGKTFAIAYTSAERQMKSIRFVDAAEFDENEQAMALQATGRM